MGKDNRFGFFAFFFRQKYIDRWGLMRNFSKENLSEHSAEVACIAHSLAVIGNRYFGKHYDESRVTLLALYHDLPEVITGDLPTPVKYADKNIKSNYDSLEKKAISLLTGKLPPEMKPCYDSLFDESQDKDLRVLVKAADKMCALIKCLEEEKSGNSDFVSARKSTEKIIEGLDCPELDYFAEHFLPAFGMTLDEL